MNDLELWHDGEVARLVHISVATLRRKMRHGFAKDELDLRRAAPVILAGRRVWNRRRVEALFNP